MGTLIIVCLVIIALACLPLAAEVAFYLCLATLAALGVVWLCFNPPTPYEPREPLTVEAPVEVPEMTPLRIGHPIPLRKPLQVNPDLLKPAPEPAPYWTSTATPSQPWYAYLGGKKKRKRR